jgi:MFS superfamily sulfate permease-like transporter
MVNEEDHPTIHTVEMIVGIAIGVVVASLVIALCIGIVVTVLVVRVVCARREGGKHHDDTDSVKCIITMEKNPAYQVVDRNSKASVYTHAHYANL